MAFLMVDVFFWSKILKHKNKSVFGWSESSEWLDQSTKQKKLVKIAQSNGENKHTKFFFTKILKNYRKRYGCFFFFKWHDQTNERTNEWNQTEKKNTIKFYVKYETELKWWRMKRNEKENRHSNQNSAYATHTQSRYKKIKYKNCNIFLNY